MAILNMFAGVSRDVVHGYYESLRRIGVTASMHEVRNDLGVATTYLIRVVSERGSLEEVARDIIEKNVSVERGDIDRILWDLVPWLRVYTGDDEEGKKVFRELKDGTPSITAMFGRGGSKWPATVDVMAWEFEAAVTRLRGRIEGCRVE